MYVCMSDGWAQLSQVLLRWARNRSERRILENTEGQITEGGKDVSHAPGPKLRALPAVIFGQEKKKVIKTTILRDLRRVLLLMPWGN